VQTIPDGTSNTILMAEKRASCPMASPPFSGTWNGRQATLWVAGSYEFPNFNLFDSQTYGRFQARSNGTNCNPYVPHALAAGGMNVLLGDGSVRLIGANISDTTWQRACNPQDNQPLGNDW
jgi:prepilin-type processing-associated H-X9-DG protein